MLITYIDRITYSFSLMLDDVKCISAEAYGGPVWADIDRTVMGKRSELQFDEMAMR
jgi:hypothetical protein